MTDSSKSAYQLIGFVLPNDFDQLHTQHFLSNDFEARLVRTVDQEPANNIQKFSNMFIYIRGRP